jgi:hypothetical protein
MSLETEGSSRSSAVGVNQSRPVSRFSRYKVWERAWRACSSSVSAHRIPTARSREIPFLPAAATSARRLSGLGPGGVRGASPSIQSPPIVLSRKEFRGVMDG